MIIKCPNCKEEFIVDLLIKIKDENEKLKKKIKNFKYDTTDKINFSTMLPIANAKFERTIKRPKQIKLDKKRIIRLDKIDFGNNIKKELDSKNDTRTI